MRAKPVDCCHAPSVAGDQSGESILRHRRHEIIADPSLVLEELSGNDGADGVTTKIFRPRRAAAVTIEARHRVGATHLQFTTKDVTVDHATSIADARVVPKNMPRLCHRTNRSVTSMEGVHSPLSVVTSRWATRLNPSSLMVATQRVCSPCHVMVSPSMST